MCVYKGEAETESWVIYIYTRCLILSDLCEPSLSSHTCTLDVLHTSSSPRGGTAMASRCPSIFRERTSTGRLPSVAPGPLPIAHARRTSLAINPTHQRDQPTAAWARTRETRTCNPMHSMGDLRRRRLVLAHLPGRGAPPLLQTSAGSGSSSSRGGKGSSPLPSALPRP